MTIFLEKEFIDAGYEIEVANDEVLLVKNFLKKEELEVILRKINKASEEDWSIVYRENLARFCMQKFGRDDVDNLVAEGKYEITENWYDKNLNVRDEEVIKILEIRLRNVIALSDESLELNGLGTMQRMQEGVELKSHSDQHTDPSIKYASILYINNDYKDGTLFFKNKKDSDLRPDPGTLVIFPGNEEYEHGVRTVGKGPIRYVLVGFIKIKNFYVNNKY